MRVPPVPTWFQRVPEILQQIQAFPAEVVDRATVEKVFRVRRRTAINLMARFGGYQAGRTFLVPKPQLLAALARRPGRAWRATGDRPQTASAQPARG